MIDRSKLEQFIQNMGGNKYLATLYLIKRVTELQERSQKLIPGSQRFLVEQSIDEFLDGKSTIGVTEPSCDLPNYCEVEPTKEAHKKKE